MMDKVKERITKVKAWTKEHKVEIAYCVGLALGATVTSVALTVKDSGAAGRVDKKYPGLLGVLSTSKDATSSFCGYGDGGPKVSELSNCLMNCGISGDDTVLGALVYTKKD